VLGDRVTNHCQPNTGVPMLHRPKTWYSTSLNERHFPRRFLRLYTPCGAFNVSQHRDPWHCFEVVSVDRGGRLWSFRPAQLRERSPPWLQLWGSFC